MAEEPRTPQAEDRSAERRLRLSPNVLLYAAFFALIFAKVLFVRWVLLDGVGAWQACASEAAFILAALGFIEMFASRRYAAYVAFDLVVSGYLLVTVVYGSFFYRIITPSLFRFAGQVGEVQASVVDLFEPRFLLLAADLATLLVVLPLVRKRGLFWRIETIDSRLMGLSAASAVAVVALVWTYAGAGIEGSSIALARRDGVFRYQAASMFESGKSRAISDIDISNPDAIVAAVNELRGTDATVAGFSERGIAAGKNVIFVQLESIQEFPMGARIDGLPVTPNLDALAEEGWRFTNHFSIAALGNTSDVEFITNTSFYPRSDLSSAEIARGRTVPGLPRILGSLGYTSVAFHANEMEYWDRNVLYPAMGFDEFYDLEFFGEEDVVGLGPSDEVLFERALPVLKDLSESGTPFHALFITLTPHHPFDLPADKIRLDLPEERSGTVAGKYLQCVAYEDWCVGQLVEGLKREGLYEDSILVVYGDHFGLEPTRMSDEDNTVVEDVLGRPYSLVDKFRVPLIIHVPGAEGHTVTRTIGQVDMLPTLADLMGLDVSGEAIFGTSAFSDAPALLGERYHLPTGSFINDDYLFVTETGFEDGTAYSLDDGRAVEDATITRQQYDDIARLILLSDAYVRLLPKE